MKTRVISEVYVGGMKIRDEYIEDFGDENVFGRVLMYHKRMEKTFPKCKYKLLKTEGVKE